jgi:hypothetical protein
MLFVPLCLQRNARILRLLLDAGAKPTFPFFLDVFRPLPGSGIALQQRRWSPEAHLLCFPPGLHAAVAELLRISYKHGGAVGPAGRLRWPFLMASLRDLLLPVLAQDVLDWFPG